MAKPVKHGHEAKRRLESSLNQTQGQVKYRPESKTPESSPSAPSESKPSRAPARVRHGSDANRPRLSSSQAPPESSFSYRLLAARPISNALRWATQPEARTAAARYERHRDRPRVGIS